jgi:hypothetical protein
MKFNSITKESIKNVIDLAIEKHGEDNQINIYSYSCLIIRVHIFIN